MCKGRFPLVAALLAAAGLGCLARGPTGTSDGDGAAQRAGWTHRHVPLAPAGGETLAALAAGEAYTTGWVESAGRFDELLVSWNLERPSPDSAAVVHVRVDDGPGSAASPWLFIGDAGCAGIPDPELVRRAGPLTTEGAGVEIDVDFLRVSDGRGRARAQTRVTAVGSAPVRVARLDLCFSTRGQAAREQPEPEERGAAPIALDVPFRSQRVVDPALADRICSPTSLAMALAYHGVDVPTAAVAARAYDPRHDLYGVWPRAIQTAFELGVPGYLARFSDWSAVRRELERGRPLVISIAVEPGRLSGAPYASTAGHLIVVTGLDARGGVLVNDPAVSDPAEGRRVYRRDELATCWMARGGTAYVLLAKL